MIIDILYLLFLLFALYKGYTKGFIHSVFSLVAFIGGIILALKCSHLASVYIERWTSISSAYIPFVSFLVMFTGVVLLVILIGKIVEKFIEIAQLGILNKTAGILLWACIMTFILSTLVWMTNQVNLISPEMKTASRVYFFLEIAAPQTVAFIGKIFPLLQDTFRHLEQLFEHLTPQTMPLTNSK